MNHAYDEFGQGSQSPYTVGRGAHPGAVLLSPQSSAMNLSNSIASPMVLSPKMGAQSHCMFFNDVVDTTSLPQSVLAAGSSQGRSTDATGPPGPSGSQASQTSQVTHNSAAGSAVLSPMVQSPSCASSTAGTTSMFLDSFTRPSSTSMLGVHGKPQHAKAPSSQQRLPQHAHSQQQGSQQQLQSQQSQPGSNPVVNFNQDINQLCSWLSMLSSAQQNTVMDNLLFTLHDDVLQYTKLKLNSLAKSGYISPQIPAIASPVPNRDPYPVVNLDSVFSKEKDTDPSDNALLFQQWSPQPTSVTQPIFDYIKDVHQRPKSADPHVARATGHSTSSTKSKRSMGNPHHANGGHVNGHTNSHGHGHNGTSHHFSSKVRAAAGDMDSGSSGDSLPRPSSRGNNSNGSNNSAINGNSNGNSNGNANVSSNGGNTSSSGGSGSSMNPKTLTDPRLLTNIPVWLKSLRLHKYSDALSSKRWDELIYLDDETLEHMGISALGARRKLLKAFAVVREYKEQGLIEQSAYV
ncbi:related to Protein VTS1 [Zygosaccharomyces bailii ISA1307]|nr:related to Protein VTS1 [Zygosaccharomyces bailii ISA1307]